MKYYVSLMLILLFMNLNGAEIWSEDFNSYADGEDGSGTTKWSVTNGTGGTFEVLSQKFEGNNLGGSEATWTSESIDISSANNDSISITISLDSYTTGSSSFESVDHVDIYYTIDGGTETSFGTNGSNSGDFGSITASQSGLPSGNSLKIVIYVQNSESGEHYTFDDILVFENEETSDSTNFIDGRVWYDNNENDSIDSGELGIGNVIVELYSDANLQNLLTQTTTASNGDYIFNNLADSTTFYVYVDESSFGGSEVYSRTSPSNIDTVYVDTTDVYGIYFGYVWTDDCMPTMFFNYDAAGNPINAGDYLTDQFAAWGIHITTNDPSNHPTMAFDSENPTGGDTDLGTPNQYWINDGSRQWIQGTDPDSIRGPGVGIDGGPTGQGPNRWPLGNLIIIGDDTDQSDPDDYAGGGTITFDFDQPMRIYQVSFIDDHDAAGGDVITTYDSTYTVIGNYSLPDLGENSYQDTIIDDYDVRRMVFTLQGSGAMSGVRFCPEEDPLSVTLNTFQAECGNNSTYLTWQTYSEQNNSHWNVLRSPSKNFGQSVRINNENISGSGTTTEITEYFYEDKSDLEPGKKYWYWLESVEYSGNTEQHGPVSIVIENINDNPEAPELSEQFGLTQNYPNPFNPDTEISFSVKKDTRAELNIFNLKGQLIKNLFEGKINRYQKYTKTWNGLDNNNKPVASGIYVYQLKTESKTYLKKMTLIK